MDEDYNIALNNQAFSNEKKKHNKIADCRDNLLQLVPIFYTNHVDIDIESYFCSRNRKRK